MVENWTNFVKNKVKKYELSNIKFTKANLLDWLENRNKSTIQDLKIEVYNSTNLEFVEKQEVTFQDKKEVRYKCYHIYSGSRGRCFILAFNSKIKIITVFPLGRTTLSKYRKRFK
jgi:hypothetical protein